MLRPRQVQAINPNTPAQRLLSAVDNDIRRAAQENVDNAILPQRAYSEPSDFEPSPVPPVTFAQAGYRLPEYAVLRDDVNQVGRLAAEAVVKEYEKSAKAVEAMGDQMREASERADMLVKQLVEGQRQVQELAEHYRAEGKKVFDQIQECAAMTDRVQKQMQQMGDELHGTVADGVNKVPGD